MIFSCKILLFLLFWLLIVTIIFFTIFTTFTSTMLVAFNLQLIALTVSFFATWTLTSTSFYMLSFLIIQFILKCLWISFHYAFFNFFNLRFVFFIVTAILTRTVFATNVALGKTFTIHFKTLCFRTFAWFDYSLIDWCFLHLYLIRYSNIYR